MNLEDLQNDVEEWFKAGDRDYAYALDALIDEFNEIEEEAADIKEYRDLCLRAQDRFNMDWKKYPKINVF